MAELDNFKELMNGVNKKQEPTPPFQEPDKISEILEIIEEYRLKVISSVKSLDLSQIQKSINLSTESSSVTSISLLMNALLKVEEISFDFSIIRMELRTLLEDMPDQPAYKGIRYKASKALSLVAEGISIVKSRQEFTNIILNSVRSINSNSKRVGNAIDTVGDPRVKK